jgi:hypothetical protein
MRVFSDPRDYFPYIGHELNKKKIFRSPIWKAVVGRLFEEPNVRDRGDEVHVNCPRNRSVLKDVLVRGVGAQREIAGSSDSTEVLVPRHRSLFDYNLGMPAHFMLIKEEVMLAAGSNLFVARYDSALRTFGAIMFLRDDCEIKRLGRRKVFLSVDRYLQEVLPEYLKLQMLDGVGEEKTKHHLIIYPGQEKDPVTRKRSGGRSKTGGLRELSPIFFFVFRQITQGHPTKFYVTPVNVSFSKYPDAIFIVHPTKYKGIVQSLRYIHEQNFTMSWYPRFTRRHTEARLDAVLNYGKPELFRGEDFQNIRDVIDFSRKLKTKVGLLESVFPSTLLYRSLDERPDASCGEIGDRAKRLFDRYSRLGVYLEKVADSRGNMLPIEEIIRRGITALNCNPAYRIYGLSTKRLVYSRSGRVYSLDPKLQSWYANTLRHLD